MPKNIKVEVLLCPHQRHLATSTPERSWPRPATLPVQLTKAGSATPVALGKTSSKGITKFRDLEAGTYKVEIPGYDVEAGTELDLTAANDGDTRTVRLAPCGGRWLVVFQVTEYPAATPLPGATVKITSPGASSLAPPASDSDGLIYATAPAGPVTFGFAPLPAAGAGRIIPTDATVQYTVKESGIIDVIPIAYWPAIDISVEPTVNVPGASKPLVGAIVAVEYRGSPGVPAFSSIKSLGPAATVVPFEFIAPGVYVVTVRPPKDYEGLPIKAEPFVTTCALASGESKPVPAQFDVVATQKATFRVQTPGSLPLKNDLQLQILGPDETIQPVSGKGAEFTADIPANGSLQAKLNPAAPPVVTVLGIGDVPLEMSAQQQPVATPPGVTTIVLDYAHSITAKVIDEHGREVAGATIVVSDGMQTLLTTMITDEHGGFVLGLQKEGTYYLAQSPQGGQVGIQERVEVHSTKQALVRVQRDGRGGPDSGEAIIDLSAYPLLTEGVSTTGAPAPAGGGFGGGGTAGAGYGQVVDQAMRDVLGWRPGGDLSGFQAALTGAFQLSEKEGHTEWKWQQRGYAVQADMGALTGAQASIYARAKGALDQMLPLLAGLTSLNPALFPEQDREAMRTVVTMELQELVGELALEGGPRVQRVDELFGLLLGESFDSTNLNPDVVQGQLGTLRQRFALTADWIEKVDDERVVTNFRVIVEQILALQASWNNDRDLLAGIDSRTSLGTILIWLSRGLEAVCESVSDLSFALDSVYIDAAQRQVIELRFGPGQPPLLLSDLLDWIVRASQDEGPRLIQDAGKDGVRAFAPVLRRLRGLVKQTVQAIKDPELAPGLRTPRVKRAFDVLHDQLREATRLAGLVKLDQPPEITNFTVTMPDSERPNVVQLGLTGTDFRGPGSAVLEVLSREDVPDVIARHVCVISPTSATATFRIPTQGPGSHRTSWQLVFINGDGTQSDPFPVQT